LREVLAQSFEAWQASIAAHFPAPGQDAAAEFASLLLTAMEGAYVRARAEHSSEAFREAGRWIARLVRA
jgi:hypothetical protein